MASSKDYINRLEMQRLDLYGTPCTPANLSGEAMFQKLPYLVEAG